MASITRHGTRWRAFVRRKGRPARSRIFDTKAEAARWARAEELAADRATSPEPLHHTVQELVEYYLKELLPADAAPTRRKALEHLCRQLPSLRLPELTSTAVSSYARKRAREGAGPATVRLDLSLLRTALRHAGASLSLSAAVAPTLLAISDAQAALSHSRLSGPPDSRTRRPTDAELLQLRDYWVRVKTRIPMWHIVLFALSTTLRLGEITTLRWQDYNKSERTLLVRDRKNPRRKSGNHSLIPLLSFTRVDKQLIDPAEIIESVGDATSASGRIFPYDAHNLSQAFRRATTACGIHDLRFHDLRHDAVSRMFEYGFTIEQVALCSGHTSWNNLKRYTQIRPETLINLTKRRQ